MFSKIGALRNFPIFTGKHLRNVIRTPPVAFVDLLFLTKIKVGWFLLKRFVDLIKARYLCIISRNHSNTLLLINLGKTKSSPK